MSAQEKGAAVQPSAVCKGLTFVPVPDFDDPSCVFGASERQFFNRYDLPDVPPKFETLAMDLFYSGGKMPAFASDIDPMKAKRATMAWLSSFQCAHEAKEATVGYAFWVWSTPPEQRAALAAAENAK